MAITIDYVDDITPQYIINIPKADMTLIATSPTEIRQIDINSLRNTLNDLMDDAEPGMVFPTNHVHTPPLTLAGVTLARVVEILDPYFILFEDLAYNVNVVGGNSNISDVTIKNQVGVNTANSAGLQDPFALQAAAFAPGTVAIDPTSSNSGIIFPIGTRAFPVNNVADAILIAELRGLRRIQLVSDITINSGDWSGGYDFFGDTLKVVVTVGVGANVNGCDFTNMTLAGTLGEACVARQCVLHNTTVKNGLLLECGLRGTLTIGAAPAGTACVIMQSISLGAPSDTFPSLDLGGAHVTNVVVREFSGTLTVSNASSQTADASFDMLSGAVKFDSSISAGAYSVRGIGRVPDETTGTAVVTDETLDIDLVKTRKHTTNKLITDPSTGIATLYDDDGVALETSQLYEDAAAAQTYQGQGAERREKFS